jgi:tetratricopeptide (TPR) repeat protein
VSDDKAQKLLQGAIKAARSGDKELARKAFLQVLKLDANNEAAWLGMATIAEDSKEKVRFLKKVLEINPANEKAQEALRRILGSAASGVTTTPNPFLAPIDAPSPFAYQEPDVTAFPPPAGIEEEDIPLPPLPATTPAAPVSAAPSYLDDLGLPPLPAAPAESGAGSLADLGLPPLPASPLQPISGEPGAVRSLKSLMAQPEPEPETNAADLPDQPLTIDDAFARLPQPPAGEDGIPLVAATITQQLGDEAVQNVQRLLEDALADFALPGIEWEKKKRRAGESEYPLFVLQISAVIVLVLGLTGYGLVSFILNSPEARRVLFAPTFTPTFTPTVTPTSTPGVTNTPSPTPRLSPTPSPELLPTITPGNPDPNFPPAPTRVYYPVGVQGSPDIDRAIDLLNKGDLQGARALLEAEQQVTINSGDFVANYYLVTYYLLQDDVETARGLISSWQESWANTALIDRYKVLTNVASARINLYEAQQISAEQGVAAAEELLTQAEELLTQVVDTNAPLDRNFMDAYVLLAQRHLLAGNQASALEVLDNAVTSVGYGSTELRLARARALAAAERYDEALQETAYALQMDPFLEPALVAQVEIALQSGQAGLAVLFSQQYLLYYPGSVTGFYLLGQAREAEYKDDLALNAYSRALLGDDKNPVYLQVLISRANLYIRQGKAQEANADFTQAIELAGDNLQVRLARMQAAFGSADYQTVVEDANLLLEARGINRAQVLLYKGQAEAALGENPDQAVDTLGQALASGRLTEAEQAAANLYLAQAEQQRGNLEPALEAVNAALQLQDSISGRYQRAEIQNEIANQSGDSDDLRRALADYEYILTWGQFVPYSFLTDTQEKYDQLLSRLGSR